MNVHGKGWKGARDREKIVGHYARITKYFKVKRLTDLEISKVGNEALYKLSNDIWAQQALYDRERYMEHFYAIGNPKYRINPKRFKWSYIDARKAHGRFASVFIALSNRRFNRKAEKKAAAEKAEANKHNIVVEAK